MQQHIYETKTKVELILLSTFDVHRIISKPKMLIMRIYLFHASSFEHFLKYVFVHFEFFEILI